MKCLNQCSSHQDTCCASSIVTVNFGDDEYSFDYRLLTKPKITETFLETNHKVDNILFFYVNVFSIF